MRQLTYAQAISEALVQAMEKYPEVFIIGLEVDGERGIFGTTRDANLKFPDRVFDAPLSEAGITGWGTGAALAGMRPVMVHARIDFLMLAMDQIANHAAKWHEMTGGAYNVPWVIRALIGRGKGQGAQHAQALHALFAHIPGLKVVMPHCAYTAKGLLLSAIEDNSPVIFIEYRWLYEHKDIVPEVYYTISPDKSLMRCSWGGSDVTIVATSYMVYEAKIAIEILKKEGISVDLLALQVMPISDKNDILSSVKYTGRLVVADVGGKEFGVSAEISAMVAESEVFKCLKAPILRIGLPHQSIPTAPNLEKAYYPGVKEIVLAVRQVMGIENQEVVIPENLEEKFKWPF